MHPCFVTPVSWPARRIAPLLLSTALLWAGLCAVVRAATPMATASAAPAAATAVVQTEQVRAELLAHAPEGLAPGKPMWLGLAIRHAPHWHTYWSNPGDSGLPTRLNWQLPAGAEAGAILWPTPKRLPLGPLVNYGYENELLLPVKLTLPAGGAASGTLPVRLQAEWLVCSDVCIPQSGDFALDLPLGSSVGQHGARFEQALAAQPQAPAGASAQARVEGATLVVEVQGLPAAWQGAAGLQFFGAQAGVIDHAAPVKAAWQGERLTLRQALSPQRSESPATLELVLTAPGQRAGLALAAPLLGGWPAPGAAAGSAESPAAVPAPAPAAAAAPAWGLLAALGLAFAGGLLLNLMPCVFPVLSLKVLGLVEKGGQRGALVAGGLAYTGGVLLSFLGLAGLLLMLRAGGAELGWGFQLQSPGFVAFLAALFTLIGLNLSGVFNLSGVMPAGLCGLHARRPVLDQALTGVLAVLIASPCTAPFMGMALGVALTQPPLQALGVFAALGLGMAAPYLLLCSWPRLARHLPRPGAWMEQFKLLLAFPMYATVVWLLWVLGHQAGIDAVAGLLGLLLLLGFGAWVLGSRALGPRTRRGLGLASMLMLVGGLVLLAPALRADGAGASASSTSATAGQRWQPWSPEAVAQARAAGRPVLVDFTAAWCVTCQFNKLGTLANPGLLGELEARQVLLLRADWTRRDPAITQALAALGRSGVPVYALYGPGQAEPRLLPELLSVAGVREAIAPWPSRATATAEAPAGALAANPARPVPVP